MLDYDAEAQRYDATRGGVERARAAADAVCSLAPASGRCLDVAGGTGIVSAELASRGLDVVVADLSLGMLGVAAVRLSGRCLRADAAQLPFADASLDLVTTIWLLHLLVPRHADEVVAEAARVLAPGGRWVTTLDKDGATARSNADESGRIASLAGSFGLRPVGAATFTGSTVGDAAQDGPHRTFRLAAFGRPLAA